SHCEKYRLSTSSPTSIPSGDEKYEVYQHRKLQKSEVPGNMVSAEVNHCDIVKHDSSRVKVSSGNSSGVEKNVRYAGHRK
ncbi:hypothetical protein MKW94_008891, partial [Papaver nudicaule]|nr:hypothetical protein [Papaver nudicaule]